MPGEGVHSAGHENMVVLLRRLHNVIEALSSLGHYGGSDILAENEEGEADADRDC